MLHEYGHAWACRQLGVRVVNVCYFRFGNPLGYVIHEKTQSALQHIVVATAPFFVSTTVAFAVSLAATLLLYFHASGDVTDFTTPVCSWLGFSFALHAFPSSGDADALWRDVTGSSFGFFPKILLIPTVGVIRMVQFGNRFWLDTLFAILIIAVPPLLVAGLTS